MEGPKITKPMVTKLLTFTKLKGMADTYLNNATKLQLSYIKELSDEQREEIKEICLSSFDVEDYILPVYQKYFTAEEMLDIIAFFRSKSGQKYVSEQANVSEGVLAMFPKLTMELAILVNKEVEKRKGP